MTTEASFINLLQEAQTRSRSLLCVGLDPHVTRFPSTIGRQPESIAAFNRAIIEATADLVCCFKPNLGFYIAHGSAGIEALVQLREDMPAGIPILLDAKVSDMGATMAAYAQGYFETLGFDAVTASPFLGRDALEPLLSYTGRGVFILAKTSNAGSGLIQDLAVGEATVSLQVARLAAEWDGASNANIGLVVGATYPEQLEAVRAVALLLPILVPGIGAQGGDLEASVKAGLDAHGAGLLISASRSICYASEGTDFQDAARAAAESLRSAIETARTGDS